MTRFKGDDFEARIHTEQAEISDEVEHLMAHDLIRKAQRPHVIVVIDDDRIVQRAAERQPLRIERFDFSAKTEGAIGRDLTQEIFRRHGRRFQELVAYWIRKRNEKIYFEMLRGDAHEQFIAVAVPVR